MAGFYWSSQADRIDELTISFFSKTRRTKRFLLKIFPITASRELLFVSKGLRTSPYKKAKKINLTA